MLVSEEEFLSRLAALEAWLWSDASRPLGLGRLPRVDTLAGRVVELSDLYNSVERGAVTERASDREHLTAKVLYFLISDAAKVFLILRELEERYGWLSSRKGRPLKLIDVGAGVGAAAVGVLLGLDGNVAPGVPGVEVVGIDSDEGALKVWGHVVRQAAGIAGVRVNAKPRAADLAGPMDMGELGAWDLCVAQAVLNEVASRVDEADPVGARARWIESWASRGLTVVIEPALRATTRPLHAARDQLLATGRFRVLAPCPHQLACPILMNERDWCHEVRVLPPTPIVKKVQEITRRRDERVKFSFVVMGPKEGDSFSASAAGEGGERAGASQSLSPSHPSVTSGGELAGRIVSDPLSSKGKVERWLCNDDGRLVRLRLLDKDRTPGNELVGTSDRGELVRVENQPPGTPSADGGVRVSKDAVVSGASLRDSR